MQSRYYYRYESSDWGTFRILTVYDQETGKIIGQCDPFPDGIPLNEKKKKKRLQEAAHEILKRRGLV